MQVPKSFSFNDYVKLDRIGITLSVICAIHCVLTPFILIGLPIMARYYIMHPYFHVFIAVFILPVGIMAFMSGFRHHHNKRVFYFGIPGLLIITGIPILVHQFHFPWNEIPWMLVGSSCLIWAHWINRKSCACDAHPH